MPVAGGLGLATGDVGVFLAVELLRLAWVVSNDRRSDC
jgi:hypothetical protein